MRSGVRIGNWLLWMDVDTVAVNAEPAVCVTVRKAISGGDVIAREFATREMADALRAVASRIDLALQGKELF